MSFSLVCCHNALTGVANTSTMSRRTLHTAHIMELIKAGKSTKDITKDLKVSKSLMWRCCKQVEEGCGTSHSSNSGRPRSQWVPSLIKGIWSKISHNLAHSIHINNLAKEHKVACHTMQRLVKEDLQMTPFKL